LARLVDRAGVLKQELLSCGVFVSEERGSPKVLNSGVQSRQFSIYNPQFPAGVFYCAYESPRVARARSREGDVRMREDRGCCEGAAQDHPIYVHIRMLQACMPNDCKNSLQFRLTEMRRSFCARCLIALCSTYFR